MWVITYKDGDQIKEFKSDRTGILSAIEDYLFEGYCLHLIMKIENVFV